MRKRSCGERQWVICTGQRALMIAGIVLVAAGLIVLLLCIPAWAWAALLGVALAIAGLVLICVGMNCGCEYTAFPRFATVRVRMVCVKVPKPLRGVVRFLVKKRRKSS